MIERIDPDTFVGLLGEVFARGQQFTFVPTGTSMLPMLDGKEDTVTFGASPPRLKKYDVAFFRRKNSGQLVLHRMVGFTREGGYIFCGDNQTSLEYGVTDADVLAIMTAFTHKGKSYTARSLRYRLYSRRIVLKKRIRALLIRIYHKLKHK